VAGNSQLHFSRSAFHYLLLDSREEKRRQKLVVPNAVLCGTFNVVSVAGVAGGSTEHSNAGCLIIRRKHAPLGSPLCAIIIEDFMPLHFPGAWRFTVPTGSQAIPVDAVSEFYKLVAQVATQGTRRDNLEHFKGFFAGAIGLTRSWSSSESWAETDLRSYMDAAASNPPLFLEALYDAFESIHKAHGYDIPDVALINKICQEHQIAFELAPPRVIQLSANSQPIHVPPPPPTLEDNAVELLQESTARSEQLLAENRPREAVQEMLWVLESLSTGFKGLPLQSGEVKGKYFNQIAAELKRTNLGTTFDRAIDWCEQLHGYLSSPTGGGVRHGIDLSSGNPISATEGRLLCNLIRSYVGYLQTEHERLKGLKS